MLDPSTALSVASCVIQFVDYGTKLVSKAKEIRKSSHGVLRENLETESVTIRLQKLSEAFSSAIDAPEDDEPEVLRAQRVRLGEICQECEELSKTLVSKLVMLKVPKGTEHRIWKSFRHALKSVWSKAAIDSMASRLRELRQELDLHILFFNFLRNQEDIDRLSSNEEKHFHQLNKSTSEIFAKLLELSNAQVEQLNRSSEVLTEMEKNLLAKTRAAFVSTDVTKRRDKIVLGMLQSLRFPNMDDRYQSVARSYENTLLWIFKDPVVHDKPWDNFNKWLRCDTGIYWIQGKAASGKSTLMRFVHNHPSTLECLKEWASVATLVSPAFFFWNSGNPEQRSHTGLLRSLLYEVLKSHRELVGDVFPEAWERHSDLAAHDMKISPESWSLSQLQDALSRLVKLASPQLKFCFFIDGLDEYDGDPDEIAQYFKDLSICSPYTKFCLSSRPWTEFQTIFLKDPRLRLQDLTRNDMSRFINDKLKNNDYMQYLLAEDFQAGSNLIYDIGDKADGVWLWVVLVVKSLIQGLHSGDRLCDLRRRLEVLPSGIEDLYAHMLKSINPLYVQEGSKIFQIFRASGNKLNIFELERALRFSDYREVISMQVLDRRTRKWNSMLSDSSIERILMLINSRCKGLLEVTNPWPGYNTFPIITEILAPDVPTIPATQGSDRCEAAIGPTKKWYITPESKPNLAAHTQYNSNAIVEPATEAKIAAGNQQDLDMEWDMTAEAPPVPVSPDYLDSNAVSGTWVRWTARQENGVLLEQVRNSSMGCEETLKTSETGADWGSDAGGESGRLSPWSYEASATPCPRTTLIDVSMHGYIDRVNLSHTGPASEHTSATGIGTRKDNFPASMSGIKYPDLMGAAGKRSSMNEQCVDSPANQVKVYETIDEAASNEAEYFDASGKPYQQLDMPQIVYLHRTVRDYLEKLNVWEAVLSLTKDAEFDPYTALLMSYVIDVKQTNRVDRAESIYDAGLEAFRDVSKLDIEPSVSHLELVEALDNAFTSHWTGQRCGFTHGHWSSSNPEWDQDEQETRREWQGDVVTMALKAELSWYLDARLSDGNLARPGLPLLAYAIGLDEWASPHCNLEVTWIQHVLSLGANPNEYYLGYTIWQYFLHYLHGKTVTLKDRGHNELEIAQIFQMFEFMLEYGADPLACCIEDNFSWENAVQLEAGGAGYSLLEVANHAIAGGTSHQGRCNICTTSQSIHQNNHSVTVIICDLRRVVNPGGGLVRMPALASLLRILEEKKKAVENQQKVAREQKVADEQQESANRLRQERRKEEKKRRRNRVKKHVK